MLRSNCRAASKEETDEDFSWEDEDDESAAASEADDANAAINTRPALPKEVDRASSSTSASGLVQEARSSRDTLQPCEKATGGGVVSYPESLVNSPSFAGSRASSEGYDVVSNGSGPETKRASGAGPKRGNEEAEEEEEGESDWE